MFLIIVIFIILVIVSLKPKQKSQNEMVQAQNSLPNIYLQARNMGGLLRTMNLAFDDASILLIYDEYETSMFAKGAFNVAPFFIVSVTIPFS